MNSFRLTVEKFAPPGNGLGFHEGKAVFVSAAVPGDELEVTVEKEKKNHIIASLKSIVKASPERRQVACPVYMECGGCDLLHLDYSRQASLKLEMLGETLRRAGIGGDCRLIPAPRRQGWRCRARFHYDPELDRFGFRARRRHRVVPVGGCPALDEELKILAEKLARNGTLPSHATGASVLVSSRKEAAAVAWSGKQALALEGVATVVDENYGWGEMKLSAAGFAQANPGVVSLMLEDLKKHCPRVGNTLELYGGSGTFSLLLGAISRQVTVCEGDRAAAARGRENAARNGRDNIRVIPVPAEKMKFPAGVELLFVDPPRSGLSPLVREKILASRASRLVYVSCNPATLARDLAAFAQEVEGFRVQRLTAFDMYPGTTHLETIAYLAR